MSRHPRKGQGTTACVRTTLMRDVRTQARRITPGYLTRGKGRGSDRNGTDLCSNVYPRAVTPRTIPTNNLARGSVVSFARSGVCPV
eukprot:6732358-Prymnesium_polylepis.1